MENGERKKKRRTRTKRENRVRVLLLYVIRDYRPYTQLLGRPQLKAAE